jgi:ethanolamine utilization protein EutJ
MKISEKANRLIETFGVAIAARKNPHPEAHLYAGVDLGTAYIVTAVVDEHGLPVAGVVTNSRSSIRDGLVLDYVGAIDILRKQVRMLNESGFCIETAAAAYPPGTSGRNAQTFANVLQAVDLKVAGLIDEPSAAALVLEITDGAVVDIGGGTTGISILEKGKVIHTADEATGGIHLDLVLAGHFRIDVHEAESIKTDPYRQADVFPLVRPVFQKMASIVKKHLNGFKVDTLYLVGGTSCFPGIEAVMKAETGLDVARPRNPLLVTPLGIALSCVKMAGNEREPG